MKLRWLGKRRLKEDELREELAFHLAEEAEEQQAKGLCQEQAKWAARRDLGNVTLVREDTRAVWTWTFFEQLVQDVRYALRTMSHSRAFSALVALSLALGIGGNTTVYSLLDSLLLRSLPVSDPASLAVFNWHARPLNGLGESFVMHAMSGDYHNDSKLGTVSGIFPYPAYVLLQQNHSVFSEVFAYCHTREVRAMNLQIKDQAQIASGELVSGDYFKGLRVAPASGRLLIFDDDRVGGASVAVITFAFSQKYFGGPANAAGQSIRINNLPFTIVGVTPPAFFGVDPAHVPDVYLPMHSNVPLGALDQWGFRPDDYLDQNYYWVEMMARLRPGVTLEQAQATMEPQFRQWVGTTASTEAERANVPTLILQPGAAGLDTLRRQFSKPLYVLMSLVALILAIACSNIANLLLARAASRKREMALRLSVGAGRLRLIRQLLTESVVLSCLGGGFGILFAIWGIRVLTLLLAGETSRFALHPDLNWHVLFVAVTLTLATGILFGLAPALQTTRADVAPSLKEKFRRIPISQVLIIGQVALSLLLLVTAGLFVRTLSNLQSVEFGFNRENLLLFQLDARRAGHGDPEINDFYRALRDRFAAIPGVRDASLAESSLINAGTMLPIGVAGSSPGSGNRLLTVGPGFMSTMQIPLLAGRDIREIDRFGSRPVAVINKLFAKKNFGSQNPIGSHLTLWNDGHPARDMEIVGVSKNARYGGLKREIQPVIYIPFDQGYPLPDEMVFALRTVGDPLSYVNSVREIVHQADPRLPISDIRTQKAEIEDNIHQEITLADLCSAFAVLALIIACVGLYSSMSYSVALRTGEIGIRMALGAQRGAVVWMVLREILLLVIAGLMIAVPTALGTSRLLDSLLFGIKPNDPLIPTLAVVALLGTALAAAYLPARRASHIDPMVALRHE